MVFKVAGGDTESSRALANIPLPLTHSISIWDLPGICHQPHGVSGQTFRWLGMCCVRNQYREFREPERRWQSESG